LYIVFLAIKKTLKRFHSCGDVGVEFPRISTINNVPKSIGLSPYFLVDIKLMDVKLMPFEVRKFGRFNTGFVG